MTPEQLREMSAWLDADERTRGLPPESFHGFDDAAMLRAHAAALEEIERLAARVAELEAALLSILSAKRYDANRGRGSEGQFVTMNIKTEIVAQADATIDAARGSKP